MQNRLLVDIGNGLTKKAFEKIFWWGPRWLDLISIDPPLSVNNPLWYRDEKNLKTVRLFDSSPEELQAEIIDYWQKPFWKRWHLDLFTSIQSKVKLWSYYQQCLAFRKICINNVFDAKEPIDIMFEQHLGKEMRYQVNKNRIKFELCLEKSAGNLHLEGHSNFLQSMLQRKNGQFFTKLLKKKLSQLSGTDTKSLKKHLKNEYLRLRMILFCYLFNWHKGIFPRPDNESVNIDTFVEICVGKEIRYSICSIQEWVKLKQQIIESLLEEQSSKQFLMIKNLLEDCLSKIKLLVKNYLDHCVSLITLVIRKKLSFQQAIQETKIRQAELIYFFKKCSLLFHPDKSFANRELSKLQTELFFAFKQISIEAQTSMEEKLKLLRDYLHTGRIRNSTMESVGNQPLAALEGIVKNDPEPTHQAQTEISVSVERCIHSQSRSNLMHKPHDVLVQEQVNPPRTFRRSVSLSRYAPVF